MSNTKELINLFDEAVEILDAHNDGLNPELTKKGFDTFKEIRGVLVSYPIIIKALEEANKNIDTFIKSKPLLNEELVELTKWFDEYINSFMTNPVMHDKELRIEILKDVDKLRLIQKFLQETKNG